METFPPVNPFASANKGQFITKEMYAEFDCSYNGGGGWWVPADTWRCYGNHLNSLLWQNFYEEIIADINPLKAASMMVRRRKK